MKTSLERSLEHLTHAVDLLETVLTGSLAETQAEVLEEAQTRMLNPRLTKTRLDRALEHQSPVESCLIGEEERSFVDDTGLDIGELRLSPAAGGWLLSPRLRSGLLG